MRTKSGKGGLIVAFGAGLLITCMCGTKGIMVLLAILIVSFGISCLKC